MGGRAIPKIAYGADYSPEQWDRSVWAEDVALMRQAGVNLVSLGIFSWSDLEPSEGDYHFEWLDEVLDTLDAAGIGANLANATASPPPWLSTKHPEMLPVLADGSRLWPGARQAFCPSSPSFREHALRITERIAKRYADHPALAMWHVSNEIGGHNIRCYCDVSAEAFRSWLRGRHGTLEELNEDWGTSFWSQRYSDWQQILPPRQAGSFCNPAHVLDFYRFSSDACLAVYTAERDILKAITPTVPVTTNVMPNHTEFDYWPWGQEVDVVAVDHYLKAHLDDAHVELALTADLGRGLAGGDPWMLMEHSTSAVNWQPRNVAKQPGEMLRNSLQHVARGSDAVMFFQWRASRFGAEKYHSAMVPHAGTATKVWQEVVELGEILGRLEPVAGTRVEADVALVFDWQSGWALDGPSHPSVDVTYMDQVLSAYRALWKSGVTVDLAPPQADLSGYRLVVMPTLYMAGAALGSRVEEYVRNGGNVVVTFMSGIVDDSLHIHPGAYPGAFRQTLGIWVEEFYPLRAGEVVNLDDGASADVWTELVHLDSAAALSTFSDGPVADEPAVTKNQHGDGTAWYLATRLAQPALDSLIKEILRELKIRPPIPLVTAPAGMEAVRRTGPDSSFLFVVNHGTETAHLAARGHDLVQDREVAGRLSLQPGGCAVVREETG